MHDSFVKYDPKVNMLFLVGAVVLGMFFRHPAFSFAAVLFSFLYYFSIKGRKGIKFLIGMIILTALLSVINPIFTQLGDHVLFTYFGRLFTLEAMICGACTAMLLVAVLTWFACFNAIMSSDRLIYCFSRIAPSIALTVSTILGLIPRFQRKVKQLSGARDCIGLGTEEKGRFKGSAPIASALVSWALEGGITTADSMQCRGYGCGPRTSFALYKFDRKNVIMAIVMTALIIAVAVCGLKGGMTTTFYPLLDCTGFDNVYTLIGMICYCIFMFIPTALNIKETISWRCSRSKI